jgi:membrane-associated phospholipid phosphatase
VSEKLESNRVAVGLIVLVVMASALFITLAAQVSHHRGLATSDPRLLHDIIGLRTGVLTTLAKVITDLGTAVAYVLLAGAGYWYWHRKGSATLPIAALGWMAIGSTLRFLISQLIARPRPSLDLRLVEASGFAFPSGHTTTATIGLGLTAYLLWQVSSRNRHFVVAALALLGAVAVGLSRSYLGVHWPTDVLGGWAFGTAWVAFGALICWLIGYVKRQETARATLGMSVAKGGQW